MNETDKISFILLWFIYISDNLNNCWCILPTPDFKRCQTLWNVYSEWIAVFVFYHIGGTGDIDNSHYFFFSFIFIYDRVSDRPFLNSLNGLLLDALRIGYVISIALLLTMFCNESIKIKLAKKKKKLLKIIFWLK